MGRGVGTVLQEVVKTAPGAQVVSDLATGAGLKGSVKNQASIATGGMADPLLGKDKLDLPKTPEMPELPTGIDAAAVAAARAAEAERIKKRRGRASTLGKPAPGLLTGNTTGQLNNIGTLGQ